MDVTRPGTRRRRRLGLTRILAGGLLGVLLAATLAATPAAADDGLFESSRSKYVVRAGERTVEATTTITLRNTLPDRGRTYYYFNSYRIPVPASAKRVSARSGGSVLPVTLRPGSDDTVKYAVVRFAPLRYGRTRTITYSWEMPGAPIRSSDPTRAGKGYAAFAVQGWGEPGEVSVEIVVPNGMEFTTTSAGSFYSDKGKKTTSWQADTHNENGGFWAFVSVRDPALVGTHSTTVGGDPVKVLSLPGDDKWADFVTDQLKEGVPALEAQIGVPWPGGLEQIREDVAPAVTGYAWFDHREKEIVLGEELDTALLLHEASHAWFNDAQFADRWVREGLAELVAHRLDGRIGEDGKPRKAPKRTSKVAVPLADWHETSLQQVDDAELYAYAAAYTAMNQLVGDLDDAALSELITAAYFGESVYELPGTRLKGGPRTDWRRFLDLVEDRTGNEKAAGTFRTWVVPKGSRGVLDERVAARESYRGFDSTDGAWQPPQGLRGLMADWQFAGSQRLIDQLAGAAADAGQLQQAAAAAGIAEPATVRDAYQDADSAADYETLGALVQRAGEVLDQVSDASRIASADPDPFTELGELVLGVEAAAGTARTQFASGDIEVAATLATTVVEQSGWTRWLGIGAIVAVVAVLAGITAGVTAGVRGARRRRSAHQVGVPQLDQPNPSADGLGPQPEVFLAGSGAAGTGEVGVEPTGDGRDVGPDRDSGGDPDADRPGG